MLGFQESSKVSPGLPAFSLFPFGPEISSLFPCEIRCSLSLEINEIKGIQVRSSESKWVQVRSSESKWIQVRSSEIKWVQVNPSEIKWVQVSSSEIHWVQVNPSEIKWVQVRPSESKWVQVRPPLPPILLSNFSWPYQYICLACYYLYISGHTVFILHTSCMPLHDFMWFRLSAYFRLLKYDTGVSVGFTS